MLHVVFVHGLFRWAVRISGLCDSSSVFTFNTFFFFCNSCCKKQQTPLDCRSLVRSNLRIFTSSHRSGSPKRRSTENVQSTIEQKSKTKKIFFLRILIKHFLKTLIPGGSSVYKYSDFETQHAMNIILKLWTGNSVESIFRFIRSSVRRTRRCSDSINHVVSTINTQSQ